MLELLQWMSECTIKVFNFTSKITYLKTISESFIYSVNAETSSVVQNVWKAFPRHSGQMLSTGINWVGRSVSLLNCKTAGKLDENVFFLNEYFSHPQILIGYNTYSEVHTRISSSSSCISLSPSLTSTMKSCHCVWNNCSMPTILWMHDSLDFAHCLVLLAASYITTHHSSKPTMIGYFSFQ